MREILRGIDGVIGNHPVNNRLLFCCHHYGNLRCCSPCPNTCFFGFGERRNVLLIAFKSFFEQNRVVVLQGNADKRNVIGRFCCGVGIVRTEQTFVAQDVFTLFFRCLKIDGARAEIELTSAILARHEATGIKRSGCRRRCFNCTCS